MIDPADRVTAELPGLVPEWRAALDAAIEADPQGKAGVALRLEVSRPYVSRVCSGSIPKASRKFIARVRAVYMQVPCPHLGRTLPPGQCRDYAQRSYAEVGADEVDHWRACRRCPNNPVTRVRPVAPAAPDAAETAAETAPEPAADRAADTADAAQLETTP